VSARTAASPFIVYAPASMLKRHVRLSKNARHLYMTLLALAHGGGGELKNHNGRWMKAKVFDAAAEICREVRLAAMQELIAAGLVTLEYEMVFRFIGGRRRKVRSRSQYTVHHTPQKPNDSGGSDPQIVEKPCILLKSIFSTVEEIDPQVFIKTSHGFPDPPLQVLKVVGEKGEGAKSSHTHAQSARGSRKTTGPFVPCYENFKGQFPGVTTRQFDFAVERILHRAKTPPCSRFFWQTSLENFFANLPGETDAFLTDLALLAGPDTDLAEVAGRLKDGASDHDLHWNIDTLDRAIVQARSRFERDAAVRSELQVGARNEREAREQAATTDAHVSGISHVCPMAVPAIATAKPEDQSKTDAAGAAALWKEILRLAEKRINPHSFGTWLRPTREGGGSLIGGRLRVRVPTRLFSRRLVKTYGPILHEVLAQVGKPDLALAFVHGEGDARQ
jgi:hypothetical protein